MSMSMPWMTVCSNTQPLLSGLGLSFNMYEESLQELIRGLSPKLAMMSNGPPQQ